TRPGETLTYGELAARAGSPRAARAVGQAMRRNPLPILVPCHRVVGERWSGGYSFGQGLATKRRLLDLERP
ncbi:MAG TPA: MGMT family protein, partial [Holophaga sp.]|nr:MGMT family protein [Holophaga sp.]